MIIKTRCGHDLPISGAPVQAIEDARPSRQVALIGSDYVGLKPTMHVAEGERVRLGQALFEDRKTAGVRFTAPASGTISHIHRGAKRALQAVVIDVDDAEDSAEAFEPIAPDQLASVKAETVEAWLLETGLWPTLRTRPFSRTPVPGTRPHSIFVQAIDTSPLAADPARVIAEYPQGFAHGLGLLAKLTDGAVYLCVGAAGGEIQGDSDARIKRAHFEGPHPAGLPGTHIHFLDPVGPNKMVWTIGYQDVIAIGETARSGRLFVERVIALGGPPVTRPRLLRTRLGASIDELTAGESKGAELRMISGSALAGTIARGALAYLGRYHLQVTILAEDHERELFHYLRPGMDKFSIYPAFLSSFFGPKAFPMGTSVNGSARTMVPIGTFETLVPMDMLPTQLLRALLVGDLDRAIALGCLELDEEDLALCTFACPSKYEYGPVLRAALDRIWKEG